MKVIRAKSAGFCMGVSLALRRLDKEAAAAAGRLVTFGPIIHNPLVMREYAEKGVLCLDDPTLLRPGDRVVIRAHGIPRETEAVLEQSGVSLADATCPKVKKAQLLIARQTKRGGTLLLFGEKDHPEVRGLLSYACGNAQVFGDLEELDSLPLAGATNWFLAAQTTQERLLFQEASRRLTSRFGREISVLDTICDATRTRQTEVMELAAATDGIIVVGGRNSGNTRRLAEAARAQGVFALHIEQLSDLTAGFPQELKRPGLVIGLTAGASTPETHIAAVEAYLAALP